MQVNFPIYKNNSYAVNNQKQNSKVNFTSNTSSIGKKIGVGVTSALGNLKRIMLSPDMEIKITVLNGIAYSKNAQDNGSGIINNGIKKKSDGILEEIKEIFAYNLGALKRNNSEETILNNTEREILVKNLDILNLKESTIIPPEGSFMPGYNLNNNVKEVMNNVLNELNPKDFALGSYIYLAKLKSIVTHLKELQILFGKDVK